MLRCLLLSWSFCGNGSLTREVHFIFWCWIFAMFAGPFWVKVWLVHSSIGSVACTGSVAFKSLSWLSRIELQGLNFAIPCLQLFSFELSKQLSIHASKRGGQSLFRTFRWQPYIAELESEPSGAFADIWTCGPRVALWQPLMPFVT